MHNDNEKKTSHKKRDHDPDSLDYENDDRDLSDDEFMKSISGFENFCE